MATYLNKDFGAADYAKFRPTYPASFYDYLIKYHQSNTNAPIELTVDAACGTGQATQALSRLSKKIIGVDHSEAMIAQARLDAPEITFEVGSDINLAEVVGQKDGVDLLTVAEGAHYFKYSEFWDQAVTLLKPGGTLAIFGYALFAAPEYPAIAAIIDDLANSDTKCGPYFDAGWPIVRDGYKVLYEDIPRDKFARVDYHFNDYDKFRESEPLELVKTDVSVGSLISLVKMWSPYYNYVRDHPGEPDLAAAAMAEITAATGLHADDRISVKWRSAFLLATKI